LDNSFGGQKCKHKKLAMYRFALYVRETRGDKKVWMLISSSEEYFNSTIAFRKNGI
jgi:hypothetical protein